MIWRFPDALAEESNLIRFVSLIAILSYLSLSLFSKRLNLSKTAQYAAAWIGFGFVLVAGYSYRTELSQVGNRIWHNLLPFQGMQSGNKAVSFYKSENGHFIVEADVEGVNIRFLLDTGASRVILSAADAQRLGVNLETETFDQALSTANGIVFSAPIILENITVGPITVKGVPGSISKGGLNQSLLGMSFLERLSSYEVTRDVITLRQ